MAVPIVKIRGVSKSFGLKVVLDNVSFDVLEGEIFGVIGASGAGKTTLLSSMIGFFPLTKGYVEYRKGTMEPFSFVSIDKDSSLKKDIGFSAQDPSFYDRLTVNENLRYFAELYNIPKQFIDQRVKKILDLVELTGEEKTVAGELSGGMKKRLDIACSLINDPKILILDEPTADLDPLLRKHIWALLKKINGMGKTVIISSHFLEEMDMLCNRIALIHEKTISHVGTTDEIRKMFPYNFEIQVSVKSQNYKEIANKLYGLPINKITQRGNRMIIYTAQTDIVLKKLVDVLESSNETILDLDVQRPTLDEVFAELLSKKGVQ